jgi:dUTP pyrophosphatase
MSDKIKVLIKDEGNFTVPKYAKDGDAGCDLYAVLDDDYIMPPHSTFLCPTNLKMAIPYGYEGQVRPRSGLALKNGITVLNSPGTVNI